MYRSFRQHPIDLSEQIILVTGGTGSFGKTLIRVVLNRYLPRKIIVLSRDELKQFELANQLRHFLPREKYDCLRFFIGDVRDRERLVLAFRGVDYVVHAAALKQIPIAEYNPSECIHTNVLGTENVLWACLENRVKRAILLSTDKACNPVNLYGASKLAADKTFVAANNLSGDIGTRFSVVRYGNVVGSRGSVIPFFRSLIKDGAKALPITDDRMTRFWITLEQGVNFVLSCFEMMRGGEIFVPKIPSMRIIDLARALAPDLGHKIVGIRPGEKLHEVMIAEDDAYATVDLGDRYVIEPQFTEFARTPFVASGEAVRVPDLFTYSSDRNEEWLDGEGLLALLAGLDAAKGAAE